MRFLVSFIVYPEKSNGVVASLTKLESLFSPSMSLTKMNVVVSTFLLLYCNSLVSLSLTTFTLLISTESDKESALKTKLLLLISNEFKKSKSEFPIPPPQKCLSERLGRAASRPL